MSRQNSVMTIAGNEMNGERAPFSTANTRPSSAAMKNPASEASMVTTMPRNRIGRIDQANAHSPCVVSQGMPNSMAQALAPRQRPTDRSINRMIAVSTSAMPKYISRISV